MRVNKLVTIFIVTHNRARYLKDCINSVLNSTYKDFDLYVLDNASTDDTMNVIISIKDERIKYIKHPTNIGGISNINYAIQMCDTEYFIIFHDDDIMEPNLIEVQLLEMEKFKEYSIISSRSNIIRSGQKIIFSEQEISKMKIIKKCYSKNEYFEQFWRGNSETVNCPSVMYRNRFFKKHNLFFQEKVGPAADQYLWFEVERNGGMICCLSNKLMKYRIHEEQDSGLNAHTMDLELYRTLISSDEYKEITLKNTSFIEKKFFRIALNMGVLFCTRKLGLVNYVDFLNVVSKEVCKSKVSILKIRFLKFLTIKFSRVYMGIYIVTKNLLNVGRKIISLWEVIIK